MRQFYGSIKQEKLAVLIDADNASKNSIKDIMTQIANLGNARIKRIFGDLRQPQMNGWKEIAEGFGFIEFHQTSYTSGKNATDIAMVIEAMRIMYTNKDITGMCLVSSDSDFTPLISILKEHSIMVYGFGKETTPLAFKRACDIFFDVEKLSNPEISIEVRKLNNKDKDNIQIAINAHSYDTSDWVQIGTVISHLSLIDNESINLPKKYGYNSYKKLIDGNLDFFDVERRQEVEKNPENLTYYIRIKPKVVSAKFVETEKQLSSIKQIPKAVIVKFREVFDTNAREDGYCYVNIVNRLLAADGIKASDFGFETIPKLIKANPQLFDIKIEGSQFFTKLK